MYHLQRMVYCKSADISYSPINNILIIQYCNTMDDRQLPNVDFLSELIEIKDSRHDFSYRFCLSINLSKNEVSDIIQVFIE